MARQTASGGTVLDVIWDAGVWEVRLEDAVLAWAAEQSRAIGHARQQAAVHDSRTILVEELDGSIRTVDLAAEPSSRSAQRRRTPLPSVLAHR